MARIYISNDPSGRIIVSFPYDPILVSKVKTIDGRRWHPEEKYCSFPKSDRMLEKMRERRVISKENGRGNLAEARSENIRNSSSIPPILGVYPNLISDVNELNEISGMRRKIVLIMEPSPYNILISFEGYKNGYSKRNIT